MTESLSMVEVAPGVSRQHLFFPGRNLSLQIAPDACLLPGKGETSMSRKVGQIISRGERRWLVRIYLGRDRETRASAPTTIEQFAVLYGRPKHI